MIRKRQKLGIVSVIILIVLGLFLCFKNFSDLKYDTSDAVTYFDEQGRYQLVNSVNQDYAIYDAEKEKIISDFLIYYIQIDKRVYCVTNPSRKSIAYAILDIAEDQYTQFYDLNVINEEERHILENQDVMVDLTKEKSGTLKILLKFIPPKWRKW